MYQCENTQGTILATKIVNTIMSCAISEILIELIVQSKSFNEKNFEKLENSFFESINHPDKMKKTLEKKQIAYYKWIRYVPYFYTKRLYFTTNLRTFLQNYVICNGLHHN